MATNIVVPELGESVVEATVARWLKAEGDRIEVGDALVELETDKIDLEVGATQSGVLARITRRQGEDVRIGEVLGVIEEGGAGAAAPPAARPEGARDAAEASPSERDDSPPSEPVTDAAATPPSASRTRATPTARRMAREHEIPLEKVQGSGAAGRVTRDDVREHLERPSSGAPRSAPPVESPSRPAETAAAPAPAAQPPATPIAPEAQGREERTRMSRRRQTIARRLVEAQRTAAMLTTFNEIDMTAVQDLRRRRKEPFKARHGTSLGIVSFFVKASIAALRQFPQLNAEIDGDDIVVKRYYDIGIAVGAEGGLVVPVLRDADRLSFAEIEAQIKSFARKADDGSLTLEDLRGGTFTITNGGVFGSLLSTPILNPPQVGILGLHKIEDRAVPVDGAVTVRPMMYVALTYDHRIVDGLEAVQFLVKVKELVEDPASMLLEA